MFWKLLQNKIPRLHSLCQELPIGSVQVKFPVLAQRTTNALKDFEQIRIRYVLRKIEQEGLREVTRMFGTNLIDIAQQESAILQLKCAFLILGSRYEVRRKVYSHILANGTGELEHQEPISTTKIGYLIGPFKVDVTQQT